VSGPVFIPTPSNSDAPRQHADAKRRLIAVALSTLLPGAGQLYLQRYQKAALLFIGLIAISLGFWPLRLPHSYGGVLFLLWMCLPLSLFAIYNALMGRDTPNSSKMSRWWILAGIPLSYIGVNIVFTPLLFASGFRPLKFASSSMEPTISAGDKFITDTRHYHNQPERRGDLVLLRTQDGVTVKRIIAIAGDTIQGKDRQILLNGEKQDEPYIQHKFGGGVSPQLDNFGPVTIPAGKYFVMGDNRDISLDSRTASFGLVDASAIVGRPLYGYRITGRPLSWPLDRLSEMSFYGSKMTPTFETPKGGARAQG
jgi:signal peptidase I